MISVEEAKDIITNNITVLPPVVSALSSSGGFVLAADVVAPIDIPPFHQSSMDGYAFSFDGWMEHTLLKIAGVIPAGAEQKRLSSSREAMRIFTGAPLPEGADTIVMQEKTVTKDGHLAIDDPQLTKGMHVRPQGTDIKKRSLAMPAGSCLSPAAIGFLGGMGITNVQVYPKPTVGILVTGNELQEPGLPLQHSQVYESNSGMLKAALAQLQVTTVKRYRATDELATLTQTLTTALEQNDLVLLTGGVSVGDYDFVLQATAACGVEQLFHKVKQRPGKPFYFGKKGVQPVFGLPGNPSSVLTCFYEYLLPALQQMTGQKAEGLKKISIPLARDVRKAAGLTHFLKGFYDGQTVASLEAQESYRLSSFANANCLIKIGEEVENIAAGDQVEIHLLPI